ncbi:MAG: ABC transporter permease [Gammaproteobacteria bacterium]|nr:hypothetical protein [Gammaproteobacteria bacterium]
MSISELSRLRNREHSARGIPRYFSTLGKRLLAGRAFEREMGDGGADGAARLVIDRLAAERLGWPDPSEAVGKTLYRGHLGTDHPPTPHTIIGVVEHAPDRVFGWGSRAFVYAPQPRSAIPSYGCRPRIFPPRSGTSTTSGVRSRPTCRSAESSSTSASSAPTWSSVV